MSGRPRGRWLGCNGRFRVILNIDTHLLWATHPNYFCFQNTVGAQAVPISYIHITKQTKLDTTVNYSTRFKSGVVVLFCFESKFNVSHAYVFVSFICVVVGGGACRDGLEEDG